MLSGLSRPEDDKQDKDREDKQELDTKQEVDAPPEDEMPETMKRKIRALRMSASSRKIDIDEEPLTEEQERKADEVKEKLESGNTSEMVPVEEPPFLSDGFVADAYKKVLGVIGDKQLHSNMIYDKVDEKYSSHVLSMVEDCLEYALEVGDLYQPRTNYYQRPEQANVVAKDPEEVPTVEPEVLAKDVSTFFNDAKEELDGDEPSEELTKKIYIRTFELFCEKYEVRLRV